MLLFQVQDTGRGIPADRLSDIFAPFTQLTDNSQKKNEGSGLGLSLAMKITETLGGRMEVQSKVGEGSVFSVYLPLKVLPRGTVTFPVEDLYCDKHRNLGGGCSLEVDPEIKQQVLAQKRNLLIYLLTKNMKSQYLEIMFSYLGHWDLPFEVHSFFPEELLRGEERSKLFRFIIEDDLDLLKSTISWVNRQILSKDSFPSFSATAFPKEIAQDENYENLGKESMLNILGLEPQQQIIFFSKFQRIVDARHGLDPKEVDLVLFLTKTEHPTNILKAIMLTAGIKTEVSPINPRKDLNRTQFTQSLQQDDKTQSDLEREESMRVLVVEDNLVNQQVLKRILEKSGVQYLLTSSAVEAVRLWKESPKRIPLILMDVEVDGPMNGLQATNEIRRHEELKRREGEAVESTFVAVMTGRSLEEDKREAEESGCNLFLTKPVKVDLLQNLVRDVLLARKKTSSEN